ncbi:MAG: indolepyruvate ferredoxin oxidoreductase subunit alpha [Candidatus Bipolaricaulota bacterium]|nr:indolepyruvate ferredoxin oxidoreductase subunit alpha [Candidatus Bipolaricaulota bacterium]MDW8030937.1 indolepyruvate ferredoxin oxidoreductase subunit alpha [Candidatus Bipolaricaulota bacterium]
MTQQSRVILLSGNEAIARGAWEAGVRVGCGYPGTPSTEILEALAQYPEVDCEWSTNEKVALEVAVGAALAGGRAIATMKHVGLNVAADPFFSVAYMGVNAGLVVVSADDPGMHSSQNEQDNRLLARAARVPLLEPSTTQECKDFTIAAFEISERYDTPVLVRTTTRISHGKGLVTLGERCEIPRRPYRKNVQKNVVLPAHGRLRHIIIETQRIPALEKEAERWAQIFEGSDDLAIIASGAAFLYAREAFPTATILKLGMTHPLPRELIKRFCAGKKRIVVLEELEPYLTEQVRALGITVEEISLPRFGELSVGLVRQAVEPVPDGAPPPSVDLPPLPPRPPILCAGCMHRGVFYVLKQLDAIVSGDIGCYTLGALAPLDAMDTCMNMGASLSMAHGMAKIFSEEEKKRLVAVIGDSTFYHSGVPALIDILYNGGQIVTIILDNHTTAMTGHQEHPGTGRTIKGRPAPVIDLESLARGLGIKHVHRLDPYDLLTAWRTIDAALHRPDPSVIIADASCVLKEKRRFGEIVSVDHKKCTECFACTELGCPAIEIQDGHIEINKLLCIACTHCQQVCADCNAGIDIPQVLELVHQKRYAEAFRVLMRANPFPAVAGRVCPHPCDHEVNALGWPQEKLYAQRYPDLVREFAAPGYPAKLSVRDVERFLGDYGIEHFSGAEFAPTEERPEKIAIIGAGPAGLSAAFYLRRRGFRVTVLEALEKPGGMMRYGIPAFRLNKEILDREIDRLSMMGVEIRCNVTVGRDVSFAELQNEYDAVVIAVGDSAPQELELEGTSEVREGLLYGVEFLRRINRGQRVQVGRRVAVIGGGNTAIDCARSAKRLGAEVTVYYRRTAQEMPAIRDEIDEAILEGITFEFQTNPIKVLAQGGRVCGLELIRMQPGPLEKDGRRRPVPIPESEFCVAVDTVILAIGERADLGFLKETNIQFAEKVQTTFMGVASQPGVFACGDVAFGYGTVTQSIATGRRVASAVAAYLKRKSSKR